MSFFNKIKVHVGDDSKISIYHNNNLYILYQEKDGKFRVTYSLQGVQLWNSLAEFLTALENQDFHDGIQAAK